MTSEEREILLEMPQVLELLREERETCIAVMQKYLLFDNQRAVSWHEVQDAIAAIRMRSSP
jgi:hypothetical protein